MVWRMAAACKAPVGFVCTFGIAVNQDLFLAARAGAPAHERILPADDISTVIIVWTVRRGDGTVVFFYAPLHFHKEFVLECVGLSKCGRGIRVFRFKVGTNVWGKFIGLAHDVPPVVGTQPCKRIAECYAVPGCRMWTQICLGRRDASIIGCDRLIDWHRLSRDKVCRLHDAKFD